MEASVSVSSNLVPHGTSIWPLCLPSTAGEERQALTLVFGSWKEPYANPACNVSEFYLIVTKAHVPPFASGCLCCTVPGTLFTHDQQPPRLCTSQLLIYTCRGLCALEAWLIPSWEACQQGQVLHIFAINSFLILINTRNILSQKLLINKGQNENKVISAVKSSRGVATCFGFKPSPSKALRKGACFHKHSGWFLPKILNLSKLSSWASEEEEPTGEEFVTETFLLCQHVLLRATPLWNDLDLKVYVTFSSPFLYAAMFLISKAS